MTEPTSLAGYMDDGALGLDGYASVVDYLLEQIPDLTHPTSVRTFARMRHEPQLGAILRVFNLALQRGTWTVDGDGCRDEVTAQIADDLGLPIKGADETPSGARRRRFTWGKHLRAASSLSLAFGHAPFAQQWEPTAAGYRLAMVQERMPQTISTIKLNSDGTLKAAVQNGVPGSRNADIPTGNHQLIWYAREQEGSNYFGQSMLRDSYGPWMIKEQMLRVLATSHRRFGQGVPGLEPQAGASITPQQEAAAQRVLSNLKAGASTHVVPPPGYRYTLTGLSGTLPDTLSFITYLDRLMTRNTLTSILDMATAERGARSLGETVMALMVFAQQAEGQRIADDGTEQIVIPLVDANWGENEAAPRINVTGIGKDRQLTAQDMAVLLQYGGLNPDDVLEADTRVTYGLPPIDTATRRLEITETDPNAPTPDPTTEA